MKLWMLAAYYAAVAAVLGAAAVAAARKQGRERREHDRLMAEEAQREHDYLHARAEVAYLELLYAAESAEEPG